MGRRARFSGNSREARLLSGENKLVGSAPPLEVTEARNNHRSDGREEERKGGNDGTKEE